MQKASSRSPSRVWHVLCMGLVLEDGLLDQLLASTSHLLKHAAAACQPTFDILRGMDPPSQDTRAKALHGHQGSSTALQAGGCRGDQARTLGQGALHKCMQLEARLVPKQPRGKAGARHLLGARRSAVIGRGSQLPRHVLHGAAALGAAHDRSSGQSPASLCKRAAHLQARAQAALHGRQVLGHAPVEQRAARRRALAAPPPLPSLGRLLAPRLRRHASVAIWLEPCGRRLGLPGGAAHERRQSAAGPAGHLAAERDPERLLAAQRGRHEESRARGRQALRPVLPQLAREAPAHRRDALRQRAEPPVQLLAACRVCLRCRLAGPQTCCCPPPHALSRQSPAELAGKPGQGDPARRTLRTCSAAAKVASSRTSQASDSGQVASAAGAPLHQPPRPPGATPDSRASASTAPARVTRGAALTPSALLSQHRSCVLGKHPVPGRGIFSRIQSHPQTC